MPYEIEEVRTFGDARQLILQTIMQVRDGGLSVQQGAVIAANMKTLNDNIQCEINAAKLAYATQGTANEFGKVMRMGRTIIGNMTEDPQLIEG